MTIDPEFVHRALATGLITEDEAERYLNPPPPEPKHAPDPKPWTNDAERLEHTIRGAASGASAISGVTMTVEETTTGRTIPAPPTGDAS